MSDSTPPSTPESASATAPAAAPANAESAVLVDRDRGIVRTSVIGIVANVLLAAFKAAVGLLSNSIAIVLDAVNNLSDALSSVITIIGTKLANKPADRKHPHGHGRSEYMTTIVIAAIIIWAGVTALMESGDRILHPQTANYEAVTLVVVAVATVVKIVLGLYTRKRGETYHSNSLVASGTDALMDAIISASTLAAALIYIFAGISLEAWLGAIIALVIIKAGVDILREAISQILGERVDSELTRGIRRTVESVPGVKGAYDLILNDYGPDRLSGSVHIEVDERLNARDIYQISHKIQEAVMREHGIILHTVGIYSTSSSETSEIAAIHAAANKLANDDPYIMQIHGFYADDAIKQVSFDLVVSWEAPDREAVIQRAREYLEQRFPDYRFVIILDSDISD